MRHIGVLMSFASDDPESQARLTAFAQGLQELGWSDGRNVRIDYRWSAGDNDRYRRNAAELVDLKPDVILASGGASVAALQQVTRTVPIVFAQVTDPVGAGYVATLRGRAATPPGLPSSNTASAVNGWNRSSRSRPA
jgi:putative ABC transport system substrate-binding protein